MISSPELAIIVQSVKVGVCKPLALKVKPRVKHAQLWGMKLITLRSCSNAAPGGQNCAKRLLCWRETLQQSLWESVQLS